MKQWFKLKDTYEQTRLDVIESFGKVKIISKQGKQVLAQNNKAGTLRVDNEGICWVCLKGMQRCGEMISIYSNYIPKDEEIKAFKEKKNVKRCVCAKCGHEAIYDWINTYKIPYWECGGKLLGEDKWMCREEIKKGLVG